MARRSDHTREELWWLAINASRKVVEKEGLRGIRARQIARDIGYTIGTLYNLFDDLDDLIMQMNGETLDQLMQECSKVELTQNPNMDLERLVHCYLSFTHENPKLWNAIFEHKLPEDRPVPEWYSEKVSRLLALIEHALAPILSGRSDAEIHQHARILWMSLFGMTVLEGSGRLQEGETSLMLAKTLIKTYVDGLKNAP
ncbi:TetR/AcrR family transcriptional regulator [Roseibium sp. MMSF_3544]|uniref:TetR/AcrR family transcriptional regulator n=1 Tax=unclassified Roseibium TaxID=2629323 RepID=UPI00273ED4CC|nr:TetR/AcrR family transcriptional regulator [Roseibium sp. MMSF_3544]